MIWNHKTTAVTPSPALRVSFTESGEPLSYRRVLELWVSSPEFCAFFTGVLAALPFSALRWETLPVTLASVDRPFECVALDSPGLAPRPDPSAFQEWFTGVPVVAFPNLGKDAIPVVPCPARKETNYHHLAAFLRGADRSQSNALWRLTGQTMLARLSDKPVWLSTAGPVSRGCMCGWMTVPNTMGMGLTGHPPVEPQSFHARYPS
jgi:hypothetical protein